MEIPQPSIASARDLDFLFPFSPVNSSQESSDITSAAAEALPVHRGVTIKEELDSSHLINKKHKFYSEMKTVVKLEKSRQSARECRARKKLRYQYLDDMILERERANERIRSEMTKYLDWCNMIDQNSVPDNIQHALNNFEETQNQQ